MKKTMSMLIALILIAASFCAIAETAMTQEEILAEEQFAVYSETLFVDLVPDEYSTTTARELFGYIGRIEAVEATVNDAIAANKADRKLLKSIDDECDFIDRDMEKCEDALEATYRSKAISYDAYLILDTELEKLDDRLDKIEDQLEYHFNYDD